MIVLEPLVVANRALRKSSKKNYSFPLTAQRIIMRSINTPFFFVILSASQRVALFGPTFNGSTSEPRITSLASLSKRYWNRFVALFSEKT